jgi:hypothetical protein
VLGGGAHPPAGLLCDIASAGCRPHRSAFCCGTRRLTEVEGLVLHTANPGDALRCREHCRRPVQRERLRAQSRMHRCLVRDALPGRSMCAANGILTSRDGSLESAAKCFRGCGGLCSGLLSVVAAVSQLLRPCGFQLEAGSKLNPLTLSFRAGRCTSCKAAEAGALHKSLQFAHCTYS